MSSCSVPSPNRNNSDCTATNNQGGDDPSDDHHGDGSGQGDENLGEPDNDLHDDDGPGDESDNYVQHNLADAITALARNVQHQGDGSCLKVREPDPFDGTDPTKL
jgi:hypothetical protein